MTSTAELTGRIESRVHRASAGKVLSWEDGAPIQVAVISDDGVSSHKLGNGDLVVGVSDSREIAKAVLFEMGVRSNEVEKILDDAGRLYEGLAANRSHFMTLESGADHVSQSIGLAHSRESGIEINLT